MSREEAERMILAGEREIIIRASSVTRDHPNVRAVSFKVGSSVHHALIRLEDDGQVRQMNMDSYGVVSESVVAWPDMKSAIEYFLALSRPIRVSIYDQVVVDASK
jgi:hypothetical protein